MAFKEQSIIQIKTIDEKNRVVADIKELIDLLYSSNSQNRNRLLHLHYTYKDMLDEDIKSIIEDPRSLSTQLEKVTAYLSDLITHVNNYEIITLNIPFIPSTSFIDECHSIIASKFTVPPILKFVLDPSITLGATIEYQGFHTDKSLKMLINTYLKAKKDEILSRV